MDAEVPTTATIVELLAHRMPGQILVIVDSGHHAQLIFVDATCACRVGDRFKYAGTTWQITGRRPHAKALVAEPAAN